MKKIFSFYLFFFILFSCCNRNPTNLESIYTSTTLDEICENKIINYVDSLINLETKVYWSNADAFVEPYSDSLPATPLSLKFENADNYIPQERFKNQRRGDLFVVSEHIHTEWDGLVEKYYFGNDSLSNYNKTYVFQGRIQFRDWLNVTAEQLRDSVFINQCNYVVYWSQTFEFQVKKIIDKF